MMWLGLSDEMRLLNYNYIHGHLILVTDDLSLGRTKSLRKTAFTADSIRTELVITRCY